MIEIFNINIPLLWLHLLSLSFVIITILIADGQGFAWMRGKVDVLDVRKVNILHQTMWYGIAFMIVTGFSMFWPLREYLLTHLPFQIKMGFVAAIILNGLYIGKISHIATERSFAELSTREKTPLLISGVVSFVGWGGAIIAATFINL